MMIKYLGAGINVCCAIFSVILCLSPLSFASLVLKKGVDENSIWVVVFCIICTLFFCFYVISISNQLFSWAHFKKNSVEIFVPFKKKINMQYDKCCDIGVASYTHGFLNSKSGTKFTYIYLSYNIIDKKYKNNINLLKPTNEFIKFGYTQKTYDYLIKVLPSKQSNMLRASQSENTNTGDGSAC